MKQIKKLNLWIVFILGLLIVTLTTNYAFEWLSTPSDTAVIAGVIALVLVANAGYWLIQLLKKLIK